MYPNENPTPRQDAREKWGPRGGGDKCGIAATGSVVAAVFSALTVSEFYTVWGGNL